MIKYDDAPKIVITTVLIILVSVFLYPAGENTLALAGAAFLIAIVLTLLAFREMIGLVLLMIAVSSAIVSVFSGNMAFGFLVGSVVAIVFVILDIFIY